MEYKNKINIVDDSFETIKQFLKYSTEEEIIKFICENFTQWAQETPQDILIPVLNFHKRFKFGGNFDLDKNNIEIPFNQIVVHQADK